MSSPRRRAFSLFGVGAVLLSFGAAEAAQAAPGCVPAADLWLNSWDTSSSTGTIQRFTVDAATGALSPVASFPIDEAYGDIAMAPDESALYGVNFVQSPDANALIRLDPQSGTEIERVTIAPMTPSEGLAEVVNALTFTLDGRIYVGSNWTTNIFIVDPADGSWTQPTPSSYPPLADATPLYGAGDFLTLPDGQLLAVTTNTTLPDGPWTFLTRIDLTAGTGSVVARIADDIYGAAQTGGRVYLASATGAVYTLDEVPRGTDDSNDITAQLAVALPPDGTTSWWGATSAQDALGGCPVPAEAEPDPRLADSGVAGLPLVALAGVLAAIGALLLAVHARRQTRGARR